MIDLLIPYNIFIKIFPSVLLDVRTQKYHMCILLFISINLNFHRYNTAQLISPRAYKNLPFTRHRRSAFRVFVFPSITESAIPFHFLIADKVKKSSLLSTSPKVIPTLFFDYGFPLDSSRFSFYIQPVSNAIQTAKINSSRI